MALMKCPECGAENVSDTAKACPKCGYNLSSYRRSENKSKKRNELNGFLGKKSTRIFTVIVILLLVIGSTIFFMQKAKYADFSGEYRIISGSSEIAPREIHFEKDGSGHYYIGGGVLTGFYHGFDYKIVSDESIVISNCLANPPIHYINGSAIVYVEDGRTCIVLSEFPNIVYGKKS